VKLPLLLYPNPKLSLVSVPVDPEEAKTEEFRTFLTWLGETLIWYRGIGISAIQTGWPCRVFSMKTRDGIQHFVNPEIESTDCELTEMEEGCLSVPGVTELVKRYPAVIVSALDIESGERKSYDLVDTEAQCAQHEIEHLDGKMFSDNYGPVKRDIVKRKIKKQLRLNPIFKELK
jgi:peptide deformylase